MIGFLRRINWWMLFLDYHLRYNNFVRKLQVRLEFFVIRCRMRMKGKSSEETHVILRRYVQMKRFKQGIETRIAMKMLNDTVVEVSERTGIPQWQVREKISRDFNIDM